MMGKLPRSAITAFTSVGIVAFLGSGAAQATSKVGVSPTSLTIDEGSSQTVSITLSEPVVCQSQGTCDVSLVFNPSDPHVTVSPSPLTISSTSWYTPQTLTINTTSDGVYTGNKSVTLTATAVSNAAYYSGFVVTIPVTVVDLDPAPAAANPVGSPKILPQVGSSSTMDETLVAGIIAVAVGFWSYRRQSRTREQ